MGMIYGHLYTEGVIRSDYPEQIKAQIDALPQDATMIIHHIKSPGGNVYAAWKAIPELMKIGKPIKSLIEGEASSIASWIAIAPASEVEATDPSTMLIHEPFYPEGIDQPLRVDDLDNAKTELEQIRMSMAEAYAKKTGKTVIEMLDVMKKNTRLTAKMAQSMGLVDKVTPMEPRRIAAEVIEEFKKDFKDFKSEIMNLFGKKVIAAAPAAVDLPTSDGKVVSVQSDTPDLVGKPATVDGAPAEGSFALADGRTLVCAGGVVTEIKEAGAPPQETEAQRLQKQLAALQAQLTQAKASEEARVKAEEENKRIAAEQAKAEETAKALEEANSKVAALALQIEELNKKPVGNQGKPEEGMNTKNQPAGYGAPTPADKKAIMASRTFMADNFPWMERHYKNSTGQHGKYADGTDFSSYRSDGGANAISILETSFNYTWNGILTTDLLFKPTLDSPALSDILTVDPGTKDKKQYNLVAPLSKVLQPYTGCTSSPNGNRALITNKTIQVKEFRMYEGWCKDDFTGQLSGSYNLLAQEWLKTGEQSFDPAGTPINKIIMRQLQDALRRDIFRRVFFADGDSSDTDYNQFNGFWPSLIDQAGASNYCVYREGTALGIGTLTADTAATRFANMFNNSNILLKQEFIDKGMAQFLVTRSVWENYYTTLVGVGSVSEQEYLNYLQGIKRLTFRGIPVIPVNLWDQFLAETDNPMTGTSRHLIALTPKENHIVGIEDAGDLNKIDSWYEMKDSKRYYRADMKMGFLGPLHCDLTTIAY
jgi:ATP-dependent protease ClpP protease subunit